jgi:hypothetical protein
MQMRWIVDWHGRACGGVVAMARTSQALVIEAVDRLVRLDDTQRIAKSVLNKAPDAWDAVLADFPELLEQSYETLEDLVALHREFARRLVEAIDQRADSQPAEVTIHEQLADVHLLQTEGLV